MLPMISMRKKASASEMHNRLKRLPNVTGGRGVDDQGELVVCRNSMIRLRLMMAVMRPRTAARNPNTSIGVALNDGAAGLLYAICYSALAA